MATASSDHRLKVWDRDDKSGQWSVLDVWKAHDAEVQDVKWNGPFVGTHLASIGEDGLLRLWEEDINEASNSGGRFKKIFEQTSVTAIPYMSIDFKNIGPETYLAAVTRDGHLSVFEPVEQDDLRSWQVLWSDYLCKAPSRTEETGFRVSWHKERLPAWPAILAGLDRNSLSLAVSVGESVRVLRTSKERKFYVAAVLDGAKGLVRDVSWANGNMRGFDVIATASKDGLVRVYEVYTPGAATLPTSSSTQNPTGSKATTIAGSNRHAQSGIGAGLAHRGRSRKEESATTPGLVKQEVRLVAELEGHGGAPWRVDWSQMGDILVSTGDDGTVRLWKKAVDGRWLEATEIDAARNV
jgi:WD40 repeat protein